jgi:hypothetical protein
MVGAAGALLIPLTIAHWTRGRGHQDVSALLPVELESVLGHETVLRIGELRRIQQSRPAGMQELADALRRSATALGDAADPQTPISERLRSVAMAEMRAGRIVVVDGWIVSETEARQCELSQLAAQ